MIFLLRVVGVIVGKEEVIEKSWQSTVFILFYFILFYFG